MNIDKNFFKISGRVPFPRELKIGEDIDVAVGGQNYIFNVVKIETLDNQNSTVNQIYILKCLQE